MDQSQHGNQGNVTEAEYLGFYRGEDITVYRVKLDGDLKYGRKVAVRSPQVWTLESAIHLVTGEAATTKASPPKKPPTTHDAPAEKVGDKIVITGTVFARLEDAENGVASKFDTTGALTYPVKNAKAEVVFINKNNLIMARLLDGSRQGQKVWLAPTAIARDE